MNYTIRPAGPEDAAGITALRRMPGVFENTAALPSERTARLQALLADLPQNQHFLVAVAPDGLVAGLAMLSVESNLRRRHSGGLGIMVRTDCQGQGIGTALMKTVLELADNWLMLVRVELEVFADNARAIHLYEKFGFEKEALLRMSVVRDGQYWDNYKMARIRVPGEALT